jgi:hypothetical protein
VEFKKKRERNKKYIQIMAVNFPSLEENTNPDPVQRTSNRMNPKISTQDTLK